MKLKKKVIDDPIFGFNWLIIIGGTVNEAIKIYAKKVGVEPWKRGNSPKGHFGSCDNNHNGFIWLDKNKIESGLIVHECFHAATYMFERLGMTNLSEQTEELFAYYLEYLVKEVSKFVGVK